MAPARPRQSATATAERHSRAPTQLPTYQPPTHPLNETAQRALNNLPRDHKLDSLKTRQRAANNHLTQAAADINDRLQAKTAEIERRRKKIEKQGGGSQQGNEDSDPILDETRQNTDEMTDKLEQSVRKIIDASAEVEGVERALQELQANVSNNRGYGGGTQSTIGASQARGNHRRQAVGSDDEGSEFEGEASQTMGENDNVMAMLKQKIAEQRTAYEAMSMAQRYISNCTALSATWVLTTSVFSYASHNDYVGFKKIVHDAQYPEDKAPPMPHASTWFASEPSSSSHRMTRAAAAARDAIEDDDDLAVASERISIKCPITLLPMKKPVTSQKCPHSFEKAAILDMINSSDTMVDGSGRRGVKAMKCPVCEVVCLFIAAAQKPLYSQP